MQEETEPSYILSVRITDDSIFASGLSILAVSLDDSVGSVCAVRLSARTEVSFGAIICCPGWELVAADTTLSFPQNTAI